MAGPVTWSRTGFSCLAALLLCAAPAWAEDGPVVPDCVPAIRAAEARYNIPPGLLLAIGVVESGRRALPGGALVPWPWTVNAEGEGRSFATKDQAMAWVRQVWAAGARSIDMGCLQVNAKHHPTAFASLEDAFDPARNADYAARFLLSLRDAAGDWMRAAGHYHSQTPDLAEPYRRLVLGALNGTLPPRAVQVLQVAASAGRPRFERSALRLESMAAWARRTAQAAMLAAGVGRGSAEQARLQAVLMARTPGVPRPGSRPVVQTIGAWSRPVSSAAAEEARLNRARLAAGLPIPVRTR